MAKGFAESSKRENHCSSQSHYGPKSIHYNLVLSFPIMAIITNALLSQTHRLPHRRSYELISPFCIAWISSFSMPFLSFSLHHSSCHSQPRRSSLLIPASLLHLLPPHHIANHTTDAHLSLHAVRTDRESANRTLPDAKHVPRMSSNQKSLLRMVQPGEEVSRCSLCAKALSAKHSL